MNNPHPLSGGLSSSATQRPPAVPAETGMEPIGLVDEPGAAAEAAKKIKAFGVTGQQKSHNWKRTPATTGAGAVRVRSFHGRLSDQGLGFMDDQINEWLDAHPEVEVKFVTSSVGTYEGKIREPALVLNLWY
jgi:hypothetical protein